MVLQKTPTLPHWNRSDCIDYAPTSNRVCNEVQPTASPILPGGLKLGDSNHVMHVWRD